MLTRWSIRARSRSACWLGSVQQNSKFADATTCEQLLHCRKQCKMQRCSRCSCTLFPRQSWLRCSRLKRTCGAALNICSCSSVVTDPLRAHRPGHMGQHRLCCARGAQHRPLPALRSCLTVSNLHRHGELAGLTGAHRGALHSAARQHQCCHRGQRKWSCWLKVHLLRAESTVSCTESCDKESWGEQVQLHPLLLL